MPRAARLNLPLCLSEVASEMDLREAKDPNGSTLLYLAAAKGHLEVCRFLVEESGLDVNCPNADGECRPGCSLMNRRHRSGRLAFWPAACHNKCCAACGH